MLGFNPMHYTGEYAGAGGLLQQEICCSKEWTHKSDSLPSNTSAATNVVCDCDFKYKCCDQCSMWLWLQIQVLQPM